ncbi:integrase arm-type DNA-binding domain-containing protein [Chitinibacter sp. GC72]|uniref:tyrosine-type recombinase/integrase n=1 Tax=Chitinibacter sp. GC72 TaxID=1526917 RepID=UPI0012F8B605|nr:integrase arm-type DNA-binding domain-containing protein [Chitinibacter sp. GC72]
MALTDLKIRSAKPKEKAYRLTDADGLYLDVRTTGAKIWRCRFWISGKESLATLGEYPEMGLSAARKERDKVKESAAKGLNANKEKKAALLIEKVEKSNTMREIAAEWIEENKPHWSPTYLRQVNTFLDRDLLNHVGDMPIKEVSSAHILGCIRKIEERGAKSIAVLVRQWAGGIFRYAIATLRCDADPTYALRGAIRMPPPKHHAHLDANELPDFLRKLDQYQGYGLTGLAIKLLMLTMVRTQELRMAEWSEFNFEAKTWTIPAEKMKMRSPHIVPLSTQALDVIEQIKAVHFRHGSPYLFPNMRRADACITSTTLLRVIQMMGYQGRATGHGFRATASTILHGQGINSDIIERQLAHLERNRVKAAYNHAEYMPERRDMLQKWADYLDNARQIKP